MENNFSNHQKIQKTQELCFELKVENAMKNKVVTINPEDTMNDVKRLLKCHKISGLPTLENDKIIGIVTKGDLLRCLNNVNLSEKVSTKMTRDVITTFSDEPLSNAINKFNKYSYGRFPVIDRTNDKLIGILTKGDIIQCLLKKMEESYEKKDEINYNKNNFFRDINSNSTSVILKYKVEGGNFKKAGDRSTSLKQNIMKLGFNPNIARRIAIATYESEMNIVIFTKGGDIIATIESDKITVSANDDGPGINDIDLAMQPGYTTAPDWIRDLGFGAGMGLLNIKNCADEMSLESVVPHGTNLKFTVYA